MEMTRRDAIAMGAGALLIAGLPIRASAAAEEAIAAFTGGAEIGSGDISLTAPEIAENGNTVPVEVSSETAAEIMLLATGNPTPGVATFKFGAKLDDGSFVQASSTVKVTIGGCGG